MSNSAEPKAKRAYDARNRRARAEQERHDTRLRVLAAAEKRFLSDGYTATKMVDIADEAGVALATVYRSAPSKADLVLMLMEQAVTGAEPGDSPDEPMTFTNRELPQYPQIAAEPDPRQQVRMIARNIADIQERVAPLWRVFGDAAAVDAKAAAAMEATLERRGSAFQVVVGLLPQQHFRESPRHSVDTLWGLSSPDMYLMMRRVRGWSARRYRDWLSGALEVLLLGPASEPPASPRRTSTKSAAKR